MAGEARGLRLHEKSDKRHEMPSHHNLEAYLHAYIDRAGRDEKEFLFRTGRRRLGQLTKDPMSQPDVHRWIGRRRRVADIRQRGSAHESANDGTL